MRCRLFLFLVLLPTLAQPVEAGIIFGRKPRKPSPNERVPELVTIVKTDKDEHKRARAAEELRQYDPTMFPDIIPALIEVLKSDKKPSVRAEAAQSLGKLRPISQLVGQALEQALANDPSMRVRLQARSALLGYHWAGYRSSGKKAEPPPLTTKEPPLADKGTFPPPINTHVPTPPAPVVPPAVQPTPPVPPAPPMPKSPGSPRPLPVGPSTVPPTSTQGPPAALLRPVPAPTPEPPTPAPSEGPPLE
jgi:hypothetical protein